VNLLHCSSCGSLGGLLRKETHEKIGLSGETGPTHTTGLPYLKDAQSNVFCRRTLAIPYGSHTIFIGEVFEV